RNIMIAACEQAKQFTLPSITTPISFEQAMTIAADTKIIFDSNGASYKDLLVTCKKASSVAVLFGPEGGLIDQEITAAQTSGFISTQLTKTILRSEDAPLLGIGILRTFIA
ncbi:RNA methyltransferase, partial [Candidatus Dependentiae bacterium]|nr:RNA methyltransferase [Candidatus Dependentiae bacterium]